MTPRRFCSLVLGPLLGGALVLGLATPAAAGEGDDSDTEDTQVVVSGRLEVRDGERIDTAVILNGDAVIDGRVDGAVVVFHGNARVSGEVEEDVVAFNGRAIIEDGAVVHGDVRSSQKPRVAEGATVEGDAKQVNFSNIFNAIGTTVWIFWWFAVTISTLVAGLVLVGVFPRIARRAVAEGRDEILKSIGAGAGVGLGVPLVSGLILLTLVGIPLGVVGLLSMAPLYLLGYLIGSLMVGSLILQKKGNPVFAFLLGWLILRLVGLVPFLGGMVTFAATLYGLGAFVVAIWAATRDNEPQPAALAGEASPV